MSTPLAKAIGENNVQEYFRLLPKAADSEIVELFSQKLAMQNDKCLVVNLIKYTGECRREADLFKICLGEVLKNEKFLASNKEFLVERLSGFSKLAQIRMVPVFDAAIEQAKQEDDSERIKLISGLSHQALAEWRRTYFPGLIFSDPYAE